MPRPPTSEREKMLAGAPFHAADPELLTMLRQAQQRMRAYNLDPPDDPSRRRALLEALLGSLGANVEIRPPLYVDFGVHIFVGNNVFLNADCVILDCNTVHIGDNVLIGPKVQLYTSYHPLPAAERLTGLQMAAPIIIEDNVWIGGGAIICQGVTVGAGSTIGAGSVVLRNVPANVFAAGNPCRVIRQL